MANLSGLAVKVLYTFDTEYKTNCLARWPNVLEIQTAYLDESTPIGVIELRTCIQAIVSARLVFPSDPLIKYAYLFLKPRTRFTV